VLVENVVKHAGGIDNGAILRGIEKSVAC